MESRLRHLAWAALVALVLQLSGILVIGDKALRNGQYRLASFPASGEMVFIGASEDLTDPGFPRRREQLAFLVQRLDQAGARQIYLDLRFDRPSEPAADRALNTALRQAGPRAHLVDELVTAVDGSDYLRTQTPEIGAGIGKLGANTWADFFGFVWYMPRSIEAGDRDLISVAAHMAGADRALAGNFPVSYFFDLATIPVHRFETLLREPDRMQALAGKKVVIGAIDPPGGASLNLPGLTGVPQSLFHIYGAETLRAGHDREIDGLASLLAALALLLAMLLLPYRGLRYTGYGLALLAVPLAFFLAAQLGLRLAGAGALALFALYGAFRAREVWRNNLRLVDEETGLPTFAALETHQATAETAPAIVVARIHRFEEVRRTLPHALHREYLLRIIARLKAANPAATIYLGPAHQLAWTMPERNPALLKEHLEGLRALFASPLLVDDSPVDVGITFGIDLAPGPNVEHRLAAAVSATERTNETYDPVAIAENTSDDDLIWNISLQARIDAAMENGEIFLAFQPKISVASGALVGVEALVRWLDPVRGYIPPDNFIRQCENVGRMSHLTRHVLTRGCQTGLAFAERGLKVPVAINISATQLHDHGIVRTVRDVLGETRFDPRLLTLEVTETYRICNLSRAAEILTELKALGVMLSMDDFGVGATSLEALLKLPFDELKIDRLFIADMAKDAKACAIVRHTIRLGEEMGINVVAEGVEDRQILKLLRDSACPVAQGYAIARPGSLDDILEFQGVSGFLQAKQG